MDCAEIVEGPRSVENLRKAGFRCDAAGVPIARRRGRVKNGRVVGPPNRVAYVDGDRIRVISEADDRTCNRFGRLSRGRRRWLGRGGCRWLGRGG